MYHPHMTLSQQQIFDLIANGLDCEPTKITLESNNENLPEWDSIGHLSILGLLEDHYAGILDRHPELAEAQSVVSILAIIGSEIEL